MDVVILGTSSMVPTDKRNHTGIYVKYQGEGLLFDCGEGIQRQMRLAGVALPSLTRIFLSHWHGDHVFGIPGLLQSLSMSGYQKTLEIYGPPGTKKKLQAVLAAYGITLPIKIKVVDAKEGSIVDTPHFSIRAAALNHGIPCYGYAFEEKPLRKVNLTKAKKHGIPHGPLLGKLQRGESVVVEGKTITSDMITREQKGKKVAIVLDTIPCPGAQKLANHADLFICEGQYTSELEQQAKERGHMTAAQAAGIAKKARAKKLILSHFSARYKTATPLRQEARTIFPATVCAKDLQRFTL